MGHMVHLIPGNTTLLYHRLCGSSNAAYLVESTATSLYLVTDRHFHGHACTTIFTRTTWTNMLSSMLAVHGLLLLILYERLHKAGWLYMVC